MSARCSSADRVAALYELERRERLFDERVDGWSAWRVLRNPLHRMCESLPLANPAQSELRRSLTALVGTVSLAWLILGGRSCDLVVKTSRTGLRVPIGDRYRDVYFDGLLSRGHTHIKIEEINSPNFERQAAAALFPSSIDPVVFTFWGRLLATLLPVPKDEFCQRVSNLLASAAGLTVSPKWLRLRLSTTYWQARLFSLLLGRIRPRAVFVSDTGEYALRIACWRRGVPFVELQHGVFNAHHPDAIPDWVPGSRQELLLPDHLGVRGVYWIRQLSTTRQGEESAVPVGDEQVDAVRSRLRERNPQLKLHVVVTSQGLDTERLAVWLTDVLKAAPRDRDCQVSIKLHPRYDAFTTDYDHLRGDPRVRIIGGGEEPNVFELLADADMHVSIASACHFDAAALGVPTGVIPLSGHNEVLAAVDGRRIFLADSPTRVWQIAAGVGVDPSSGREFAEPGFVQNLERLLHTRALADTRVVCKSASRDGHDC